ncbi:cytochrome P450, partial [Amylocarpus encephaloides]
KRLEAKTDRLDFRSYILASEGRGTTIEVTLVAAQVLIVAGSETTSTALLGAASFFLEHPSTFQTLSTGIRSAFQVGEVIPIQSTAGLPYLNTFIEEALRLSLPRPGTSPRIAPKGEKETSGQYLAGGYSIGAHPLPVNRSSVNSRCLNPFKPERGL